MPTLYLRNSKLGVNTGSTCPSRSPTQLKSTADKAQFPTWKPHRRAEKLQMNQKIPAPQPLPGEDRFSVDCGMWPFCFLEQMKNFPWFPSWKNKKQEHKLLASAGAPTGNLSLTDFTISFLLNTRIPVFSSKDSLPSESKNTPKNNF